jgi:ABC-type bacteriocin/lantibiotic exporter with double-glycine peptidase domain
MRQTNATECGIVCLCIVLDHHGRASAYDEVRSVIDIDSGGTTAAQLLTAARYFGLRGRGVRIDAEHLQYLGRGTILHLTAAHYVVLDKVRRHSITIVDPRRGRVTYSRRNFAELFSGVALELEATEDLSKRSAEEAKAEGTGLTTKQVIWQYVRILLGHWRLNGRVILITAISQQLGLAFPLLTATIVDRVVPHQDLSMLAIVAAGFGMALFFQVTMTLIRTYLLMDLRARFQTRLSLDLLDHMAQLPYKFFGQRSLGELTELVTYPARVGDFVASTSFSSMLDVACVLLYAIMLLVVSPLLGAVVLALSIAQLGIFSWARRYQQVARQRAIAIGMTFRSQQIEMMAGMQTLKAMGAELRAVNHYTNLYVDSFNAETDAQSVDAHVGALLQTVRAMSPVVILSLGAYQVVSGTLSLGTMLAVSSFSQYLLSSLNNVLTSLSQLPLIMSYLERSVDVLKRPLEQDLRRVRPPGKIQGHIVADKVSFRYLPSGSLVLDEVSAEIFPGQQVAIVGRSGSGKSTLAALMLGLYHPLSGRVLYDGMDLNSIDIWALRRQLGVQLQEPFLFAGMVKENIAYVNPDATMEEIVAAATRAQIDEDIRAMPLGYETVLSRGGASLSGGQRQRMALARCLLRKPAVLLLDEATSSLDATTERAVHREISNLQCTRIIIAHRLSTVMNADVIIVLDKGKVVEQGIHQDLLSAGGIYAEMVSPQLATKARGENSGLLSVTAPPPDMFMPAGTNPGDRASTHRPR